MAHPDTLTLHNAIIADPTTYAYLHIGDWTGLRDYLNATANPNFIIWRTDVEPVEIMQNGMDWTRVDNLSVGKARIWEWLTKLPTFDASRVNVRAGIDAAWVGTAADLAVRAQVYTHCKRAINNFEKLFASGTGTDASPGTTTYEGTLNDQEVIAACFHSDWSIWE